MICADTSFLLSLAGNDSNSASAFSYAGRMDSPIVITALNRLEFENAIALLVFRGALPGAEAATARATFAADESAGRITEATCHWPQVLEEALRMSRARTGDEGHRLLDILHVAGAIKLKAKAFLSFDKRQRELAVAEGLQVGP